jgi:hypothetical protein
MNRSIDLMSPDFYAAAACRGADPELFFDVDNEHTNGRVGQHPDVTARRKVERRALAKSYCDRCPVRELCHMRLGLVSTDGVFGGRDKDERRHMRRHKRESVKPRDLKMPAREEAVRLHKQGFRVRDIMRLTKLDYAEVLELRPPKEAPPPRRRPDPPGTWAGSEAYVWMEAHWQGVQYLGDGTAERAGQILVQSKSRGVTVRKWCKAADVVVRPDISRYTARRHDRKDLNVPRETAG